MPDYFASTTIGVLIWTAFIAMIPVIELRGAIPVGIAYGLDWPAALTVAILGNLLPIPFILIFLTKIFAFMKRFRIFRPIVEWFEKRGAEKSDNPTFRKYEFWGLLILVAIPLPGTGAWTGALAASVMYMRFRIAMPSIALGVLIAGIVVTLLSEGVFSAFGLRA